MEWEDIKGNIIFIIGGMIAALFIFGLKDKPKNAFSGINKVGVYICLIAGVISLISLVFNSHTISHETSCRISWMKILD